MPPCWWSTARVGLLIVILASASVGVASLLGTRTGLSPLPAPSYGARQLPTLVEAGESYDAELVWSPLLVQLGNLTNEVNISFDTVEFHFWLEGSPSVRGGDALAGWSREPNGLGYAFAVLPNLTGLPIAPSSESGDFSPDGVFGIAWVGFEFDRAEVELCVGDPVSAYATGSLEVPGRVQAPLDVGPSVNTSVAGVDFEANMYYPQSPVIGINVTATFTNGTQVRLGLAIGGAISLACSPSGPLGSEMLPTYYISGETACEETASPDHSVAVLGPDYFGAQGQITISLLVRVG